ncbi:hypothetical protein MTR_3g088740 [Medicago truncatula]|uniref:Uncharacterized protein n=1 Tax=Medicago truncatula TaxID=3880 RepID=A0A072V127_MEDTR|nr:hypothetical protein MTR_3g088740 [Medicago truncatula]
MTKVFAIRLALVIDSIISRNQLAFLKERLLVDGDDVVNEVVDLAKKDCLIFKVGFEKTKDSDKLIFEGNFSLSQVEIHNGLKQGEPLLLVEEQGARCVYEENNI